MPHSNREFSLAENSYELPLRPFKFILCPWWWQEEEKKKKPMKEQFADRKVSSYLEENPTEGPLFATTVITWPL